MSQRRVDKPGFTQHGLMSQSKNWFHPDGLMSQKGSGKPDFTQNGLMSQRGVDESGFTQNGLMSLSGKGFHTSPDTSWLPRRETIQPRKTNSLVRPCNSSSQETSSRDHLVQEISSSAQQLQRPTAFNRPFRLRDRVGPETKSTRDQQPCKASAIRRPLSYTDHLAPETESPIGPKIPETKKLKNTSCPQT